VARNTPPSTRQRGALLGKAARQLGVEMVEHGGGGERRDRQVFVGRRLDLRAAVFEQRLLVVLAPMAGFDQVIAQAGDGLLLPMRAYLRVVAVARGVVGGGVIAEAIGHGLDQGRPAARARLGEGAFHAFAHGDHVVAVDLLAGEAGGDRLLRQGLGRTLLRARHRDGPLIVVDNEDQGQAPHAGEVHGLVEVTLRGRPVAEHADRRPPRAAELQGEGHAGGMRRVCADGHADGEVLARAGEVAAPLVAAPVEQDLDHGDAAQDLRALLAERGQQHVLGRHGGADADRDRLLAEGGAVGAEPSGALQRDRLGVEGTGQHHGPVERDERLRVPGEIGELPHGPAVEVEEPGVRDLEAGGLVHDPAPRAPRAPDTTASAPYSYRRWRAPGH
jgi:hypothetical protein